MNTETRSILFTQTCGGATQANTRVPAIATEQLAAGVARQSSAGCFSLPGSACNLTASNRLRSRPPASVTPLLRLTARPRTSSNSAAPSQICLGDYGWSASMLLKE